jgi:DNA-directed RNA polymerase specialized sigma24 family protein
MIDERPIDDLLERVRRGEPDAADELVRRYESAIRVAVRTRLSDPALRRQFDSMDICQSVLGSFFVRASAGQYDLSEPRQLVALLTRMAQNKLAMHARSQYRQRRDVRRDAHDGNGSALVADKAPGPHKQAVDRELLGRAYALMDAEIRRIADCRAGGANWIDVAAQLGGTADARRKQFSRAMDSIARQLELE